MSDLKQLIQQARQGNNSERDAAFQILMTRYHPMAYQRAYASLGDRYLAEEAVQEAFIKAYTQLGQLKEPEAFPVWLRRIVMTQSDRLVRGKRLILEPIESRYDLAEDSPGPEAHLETEELHRHLHTAISTLPEHERAVTEGFYMKGDSQKEIAKQLDVPVTTVKKRLQYAREHLRDFFMDLNAAVDMAIDEMFKPGTPPEPARQPLYVRTDTQPPDIE